MRLRRRALLKSLGAGVGAGALASAASPAAGAGGCYTKEYYETEDGGRRMYRKYVPSGADGTTDRPLVVMLHGCGQSPDEFRYATRMNEVAEAETFLAIYPDQTVEANADECWNWFADEHTTRGSGEAALITGMAREVAREHAVDADRVYVAGMSAGAAMVPNLLAAYPDVYAAGAVHSGLEYDAADNAAEALVAMETGGPDPQRQGTRAYEAMESNGVADPVPTMVVHGTRDAVVNVTNGHQATEQATQTIDLARDGADDDGVDDTPEATRRERAEQYDYTVAEYRDPAGETVVERWLVEGMGHGWSGGRADGADTAPGGPDASRAIWAFFSTKSR